jgi:hypothetical protein
LTTDIFSLQARPTDIPALTLAASPILASLRFFFFFFFFLLLFLFQSLSLSFSLFSLSLPDGDIIHLHPPNKNPKKKHTNI